MTIKTYIQIFLASILFIISLFLYLNYFKKTNLEKDLKVNMEQSLNSGESIIEDLVYLSTDKEGNPDIIYLENVNAIISLRESDYIFIKSKFAKYNSKNFDTLFNNSVSVDYGEHFLESNFLDLSFENNLVSIYDNVRYVSGFSSLIADKAEIDILNKKTKIFMENPNKKVQINNISKNGNN